eukprot:197221_1
MSPQPKEPRSLESTQKSNLDLVNSPQRFGGGREDVHHIRGIGGKTTATNALCGRTFHAVNKTQGDGQSREERREWRRRGGLRSKQKVGGDVPSVSLLKEMTVGMLELYARCNEDFKFKPQISHRILTTPSEIVSGNGKDNKDGNLVMSVFDVLTSSKTTYSVLDLLGKGTFGQVFRCQDETTKSILAIKVVKSKPAYRKQAEIEIQIAELLNTEFDKDDEKNIVRIIESFAVDNHLCLVFELLSSDLYVVLKQNQFRGFPITVVCHILKQIINALLVLKEASIIHCDLKPENILTVAGGNPFVLTSGLQVKVKLIDFGSSCFEGQTMCSYIQSRFYRSPEVLLGLPYDSAIDMWSLGCISLELFLGLPIFPGVGDHDQIVRIMEMLGHPPEVMLNNGGLTPKFFNRNHKATMHCKGSSPLTRWTLKTPEQFARDAETKVVKSKTYFRFKNIPDIVRHYPMPYYKHSSKEKHLIELENRRMFTHFVMRLLALDPRERLTPQQAANHPFITRYMFPQQPSMGIWTSVAVLGSPAGKDMQREGSSLITDPSMAVRKGYLPKQPTSWSHQQPHHNQQLLHQAYLSPVERNNNNVVGGPFNRKQNRRQLASGSFGGGLGSSSSKHVQYQMSPSAFSQTVSPLHTPLQPQRKYSLPTYTETGALLSQLQDASSGQGINQNCQLGYKSSPIDVPIPTSVGVKNHHYQASALLNNNYTAMRNDGDCNNYYRESGASQDSPAHSLTRGGAGSNAFYRRGGYSAPRHLAAYSYSHCYSQGNQSRTVGLQGSGPIHFPDFAYMVDRPRVRNEQLEPLPHCSQPYHSVKNQVQGLNNTGKRVPAASFVVAPNEQDSSLWLPTGGSVGLVRGKEAISGPPGLCGVNAINATSDALLDHNTPSFRRNAERPRSGSWHVGIMDEAGFMGREEVGGGSHINYYMEPQMASGGQFETIHFNEATRNMAQIYVTEPLSPPSSQAHSPPTASLLAKQLHQYDVT